MGDKKKRFIIIDGNALLHRAYHALPPLTTKKGELVNAIYGFLLVFFKAVREFQPDFIAAAFDLPAPTFRHLKFKAYKATRPKTPEELSQQFAKLKEALKVFNVPIFEKEGFEADDVIGTLAKLVQVRPNFTEQNLGGLVIETIILSGDLDNLQLVNPGTKVYTLRKGVKDTVLYDENKVSERYRGLKPFQLTDFRALKGDPSDNIPGVPGIGEKTAIEILKEFGSLENLYQCIEQITIPPKPSQVLRSKIWEGKSVSKKEEFRLNPRLLALLKEYKNQAFLSKMLSQIQTDIPIDFNLKECQWGKYDKKKATSLLQTLEFHSLIQRLP